MANAVSDNDTNNYTGTSPRYIAIVSTSNDLTVSSGKATCFAYSKTQSGYKAKVKAELQKKGSNWSTMKTWSVSDSSKAVISEAYTLTKGYSYRLKTTHYALDSNGKVIESTVKYSSTISY